MQSSNDSIIFQLTNIGAAQRDSPVRTPKNCVTPRNEPRTPPSSSKGKRWTERWTGFPRSSERRKKSVGSPVVEKVSSAAHSNEAIPPMTSEWNAMGVKSAEPDMQYPSRTDSLPRPTMNLGRRGSRDTVSQSLNSPHIVDNPRRMPPPRIPPFGYSDVRSSPKKSFLNCVCTVCDEPIFTRSHGERIIELECGHISHQECLLISFEASHNFASDEFTDIFPHCNRCRDESKKDAKCLPKNPELKDKLISEFLINKNLGSPEGIRSRTFSHVLPRLQKFSSTPVVTTAKQELRQGVMPPIARSTKSAFQVPMENDEKLARSLFQPTSQVNRMSKGSPWVASSSIVSSVNDLGSVVSTDVSVSDRSQKLPSERNQLPILRAFYMQVLLTNFKNDIVDWQVDTVYGLLRLVDKLYVSRDGLSYSTCLCYLFEKAFIVATLSQEASDTLTGAKLTNLQTFIPVSKIKVEAVDASIFKCSLTSDARYQELYLRERLETNSSQIIEKWISGLLNRDLIFDESNFTSSLPTPPIIRQVKGRTNRESLIGMVGSSKAIELSGLDQLSDSVIIRRGVKIPAMGADVADKVGTIESVMTNVSSIISMKRETPGDLVVVLQCDLEDPNLKNSLLTMYNSFKALKIKFPNLSVCVVDSSGFVVTFAPVEEVFSPNGIPSAGDKTEPRKFDPTWLKHTIYANSVLDNVGIAVISGTSMEEGKSCLLMNYKPFTCIGRRRPNELKVKVGYLNVDYSDSIQELVEVASWANILEALCYSFSLVFGEDEDEEVSGMDSSDNELSTSSRMDLKKSNSLLDSKSLLLRASDKENSDGESYLLDSRHEPKTTTFIEPGRPGYLSAKKAEKGWDPLLDDIESAIRELQRGKSASPGRQSGLYTYL